MSTITTTFKKVKLLKDGGMHLEYETTEFPDFEIDPKLDPEGVDMPDPIVTKHTVEGGHRPHPDFVKCFTALVSHLIMICELPLIGIVDDSYKVTSISLAQGACPGVTITGQKKLSTGKVLNLNTPFTPFDGEDQNAYKQLGKLNNDLDDLLEEAEAYLKGKKEAEPQLSLFQ